ncbi:hypothetical protein ACGFZR_24745 [Streptomyces sp. NPDC048241]
MTGAELRWAGVELAVQRVQDEVDVLLSRTWPGRLALRLLRRRRRAVR